MFVDMKSPDWSDPGFILVRFGFSWQFPLTETGKFKPDRYHLTVLIFYHNKFYLSLY